MNNKFIKSIILILLISLSFGIYGCNNDKKYTEDEAVFEIHSELQKKFLMGDYQEISFYADGQKELSKPEEINIVWEVEKPKKVKEYIFNLSEASDFLETKTYVTNTNEIALINLKIHTKYYWYVSYNCEGEEIKTDVKSFYVSANYPRNLLIDGLTNVRDVGGYQIGEGKYTNQGLIYRSSRLNENETTDLLITESGIKEMLDVLKIKSELDVRQVNDNENGGITQSPLGETVSYFSVPMKSGGNCILLNKDIIKDAFAILGNQDNYPIVIHCSIGTDRTGMLCFLINALLGVDEEALYKDYLFSNFGNIGRNRTPSAIKTYISTISSQSGETFAEKTYNYLLSIDVAEEDLISVIDIMAK